MPKTGATRYQKFLKTEKGKTKLKSKKDLPKGTNVTKTNFKVKKIVIKEQCQQHGQFEALSTRKLTVKDLLSRLNHHNIQAQCEALEGLYELLTTHTETQEKHLGALIHGISPLLLNIEKKVRSASHKLLQHILSCVKDEKLEPFYNILSTYLRSGMTHIDSRIQDDSLLHLDILLTCIPKLVIQDFHKILPNFLDMVSKLRVDSKPGRTLTINLDSQISTVKWRVKVLHRLQKFFQYYVDCNFKSESVSTRKASIKFDEDDEAYYSLFNPNYISVCPVSCFSSKSLQDVSQIDEIKNLTHCSDILIPLLFETWVEVCPRRNTEKIIETVLSEDTALLFKCVLELLSIIWKLVHHFDKINPSANIANTLSQKYRIPFEQYFLSLFPYVINMRPKHSNTSSELEESVTDPKLTVENLEICHLYILLNQHFNINQKKEISSVVTYVTKIFNQKAQESISHSVMEILNAIFTTHATSWSKNLNIMNLLLPKIVQVYYNTDTAQTFKQHLFSLLCHIALDDSLRHVQSQDIYKEWIKNLPDILLQESISPEIIDMIHKFAVKNNLTFNYIIQSKLLKIIENLPVIIIAEPCSELDHLKLISMLYYIKKYDFASLNLLEIQILNNVYSHPKDKYVLDVLRMRSSTVEAW